MIESISYFAGRDPVLFVIVVALFALFVIACFNPWKRRT
jgi:hypothetical protein